TTAAMRPLSTTTARPFTGSAPVPSMSDPPIRTRGMPGTSWRGSDLEPGIESVAETVAEEVDTEHGDQDGEAGERRQPPRRREVDAAVREHAAPRRGRGLPAKGPRGRRGLE